MKNIELTLVTLLLLTTTTACSKFNSAEGKASAQKLANTGVWVVTESSEDNRTTSAGTMERSDCAADVAIGVKPLTGAEADIVRLSIDTTNPQYVQFKALRIGDRVSFDQASEPTQTRCGDGAYVKIKS